MTDYSEPVDTRRPTRYRDPPRGLPIEATPRPGSGPRPTARNVYIGVAQTQIGRISFKGPSSIRLVGLVLKDLPQSDW